LGLTGEVITSPFSFIATSSSIVWCGLDIKFADIDESTLNIDPAKIEEKISPKTSAIVPVHVFGNPCEVEEIEKHAELHNLKVIYDASHCFGVKYKGESILNRGDVSTLSFHATKLFHTIEGGALIINDDKLCEQARNIINFGITGEEKIDCLGINGKLNEFQAAMGLCLLDKVEGAIQKRKIISECYDEVLSESFCKPIFNKNGVKNYAYYPVIFKNEASLLKVQAILKENKIYPRRYFYTSLNQLRFLSEKQDAPVSESMSKKILCLPLSASLTVEECFLIAKLAYFNAEEQSAQVLPEPVAAILKDILPNEEFV
jgi:dTDP-4-amino-4,6-dideoxygalactose transaminase